MAAPGAQASPVSPQASPVAPQASPVAPQPAEKPQPVDFVCEFDVRQAMKESRKIYIGTKSIITPSARDLAGSNDILVVV
jgi:hypothetical protein